MQARVWALEFGNLRLVRQNINKAIDEHERCMRGKEAKFTGRKEPTPATGTVGPTVPGCIFNLGENSPKFEICAWYAKDPNFLENEKLRYKCTSAMHIAGGGDSPDGLLAPAPSGTEPVRIAGAVCVVFDLPSP